MNMFEAVMLIIISITAAALACAIALASDCELSKRIKALESGTNLTVMVVDEEVGNVTQRSWVIVPK